MEVGLNEHPITLSASFYDIYSLLHPSLTLTLTLTLTHILVHAAQFAYSLAIKACWDVCDMSHHSYPRTLDTLQECSKTWTQGAYITRNAVSCICKCHVLDFRWKLYRTPSKVEVELL